MTEDGRAPFPAGFLWGTATAAHQVEGDNRNSDWWAFEQQPGRIYGGQTSGIACDHYNRYREDFALLREMNQNAHRLSIEWSRVEPSPGEFDRRQLRHYRDVLAELREQRIEPMLTLHHFTNPLWFTEKGGWAAPGAAEAFLPFVRRVVDELGDLVNLWCTINEPNNVASHGWLFGEFPPGRKGDLRGAWRVLGNLHEAHEGAYREIKQRLPAASVGLSHHRFLLMPASSRPWDSWATRIADGLRERWPVGRGLQRIVEASCDYIGIAHYWGQLAAFAPFRRRDQFLRLSNPEGPVNEMGWVSDPLWMRSVLAEAGRYRKPVYVTENGISTADDAVRQEYMKQVLAQVRLAIDDGVDVRGYFHWTSMDNFEWSRGYSQPFGLVAVDRQTLTRTPKPSAWLYARIATAGAVVG